MKLKIEIPDEVYNFIKQRGHLPYGVNIAGCILDGEVLKEEDDRETYTGNDRETVYVHRVFSGKVDCCAHCPYYEEDNQMGAVLISCAALPGKGYEKLLNDISWRNANNKISSQCPYKKGEVK